MEKSAKSNAINMGIVLGVILSLITVIGYTVYQGMYSNWWFGILLFVMTVTFGIVSSVKSRKLLGGYIEYKEAFTSYLLTIAISTIIATIISCLLYTSDAADD